MVVSLFLFSICQSLNMVIRSHLTQKPTTYDFRSLRSYFWRRLFWTCSLRWTVAWLVASHVWMQHFHLHCAVHFSCLVTAKRDSRNAYRILLARRNETQCSTWLCGQRCCFSVNAVPHNYTLITLDQARHPSNYSYIPKKKFAGKLLGCSKQLEIMEYLDVAAMRMISHLVYFPNANVTTDKMVHHVRTLRYPWIGLCSSRSNF